MISVIVCSIDSAKYNNVVNNYSELLATEQFEIIGIHDATSLCEGYNRGIQRSKGSTLIFSHDDIEIISPDFVQKIENHLSEFDIVGVAGTTLLTGGNWVRTGKGYIHGLVTHRRKDDNGYNISVYDDSESTVGSVHALDGLFFAVNRNVVDMLRFDEETFDGFHLYDLDFTFSAHLAGYKLAICNDIAIIHDSEGSYNESWRHYRAKFNAKYADQLIHNRKLIYNNKLIQAIDVVAVQDKEGVLRFYSSFGKAESRIPAKEAFKKISAFVKDGQMREAIHFYESIDYKHNLDPEILYALCVACCQKGMLSEAELYINSLLKKRPEHAVGWAQLGLIYEQTGRIDPATECFTRATRLEPREHALYKKLSDLLFKQGLVDKAKSVYAEGLVQHSRNLFKMAFLGEAAVRARDALVAEPDNASALHILASAQRAQGKVSEAEDNYRKALKIKYSASVHSDLLLCLNYINNRSLDDIFIDHKQWESLNRNISQPCEHHTNKPNINRRLRVGYISPDFRQGPVSNFFQPILENHDNDSLETICYDSGIRPVDIVTDSLRSATDVWRDIRGISDEALFQLIQNDAIDILVDLAGHTPGNRLSVFLRKPAPVQATYLGYVNTTGIAAMDYRLVDSVTDPESTNQKYSEELVRLKRGLGCYRAPDEVPDVVPPPALQNDRITFGSLNNLTKMNNAVIELWARVLHANPLSVILICRSRLVDPETRLFVLKSFSKVGINEERVLLIWEHPSEGHWVAFNKIDIMLDAFPWNAHTTACECLWMGVPIVTLKGDRHSARLCASMLHQVGLPELIADTSDEFVDIACNLANNLDVLADMRKHMREKVRTSPLCDAVTFTRELEKVYRKMWKTWCTNGKRDASLRL